MNVLLVAEYYFANSDLVKLSRELAERNHCVSVATSFRNLDKREPHKGVDIFEITPFVTIYSIPHSLSFPILAIQKLLKERDIEITHALMDYSTNTAVASLVSKVKDIPFVCTVQGIGTRTGRFVVDALAYCYDYTVERLIFRNANKLILLSKSLASRTRKLGVSDSKTVVIPSGVDCTRFDPGQPEVRRKAVEIRKAFSIDQNDFVIGFVGRLVPAKGLSYLVTAAKQVQDEFPNVVLLFIGDGPQRAELELRAEHLGVKTVFTGYQMETPPFYSLMDVFVLPSFYEGLPSVVLEAMAMEKPVVATNAGGTSDLVADGENGFLIKMKSAQHIASCLKRLIADRSVRIKMGKMGREIAQESFQWNYIVDQVETVYKEVV